MRTKRGGSKKRSCCSLKTGCVKKKKNFVARPGMPNAPVISCKGIAIQTVHIHPPISRYG